MSAAPIAYRRTPSPKYIPVSVTRPADIIASERRLAVGVAFHVSCAFVMGLNRFFWAFCGCYPSVWVTAMLLR